jgi:hypothetical protein
MYAEFYAQNPLLYWALVGLGIFVISFAGVLLYVLVALRDKRKVAYLASLPLESDSQPSVEPGDAEVAGGRV